MSGPSTPSIEDTPREPSVAHGLIPPTNRRNWLVEGAALLFGGLVALIPVAIGLIPLLDPWRRKPARPAAGKSGGDGKEGYLRISSLEALPVGGTPQRFPVIADQIDAWNFTPNQPIGAVFLQRVGESEVRCFNATCPHAGCSVSCDGQAFVCPCHNSSFNLDGTKRTSETGRENTSPRDMDTLEVDPEQLAANEVWVQFRNFYTGRHDKVPKS
jgi:Rieske Fe-S protein